MSVSSPQLKPTRASLDFILEKDYMRAATLSTKNQRDLEAKASAAAVSVTDYLQMTGEMPTEAFYPRDKLDEMEADYMRAVKLANANQQALEAKAWKENLTVEGFMKKHKVFEWALGGK